MNLIRHIVLSNVIKYRLEQKRFYVSKGLRRLKVECDLGTIGIKGSGKRGVGRRESPTGLEMLSL